MLAFDQETWTAEQEIPTKLSRRFNADELDRERLSKAAVDPDDDDDLDEDDDLDLDDDDLDEEDDLDNDVVPGYDEDLDDDDLDDDEDDDYNRINGQANRDLSSGVIASYDEADETDEPNEIPEHEESDDEDLRYPSEQEVSQPEQGSDGSCSEQIDVTPPNPQEFPSVGNTKTDFESRPHGRTTGRMLGHEPGTEGI